MTGYIRTARTKHRPGLSPYALQLLRRLEIWQHAAGSYPTPQEIVEERGRRDWISLQGLMGRGLVNMTEDSRVRLTSEGWRYLKAYRG
jgi:hypothetical protein